MKKGIVIGIIIGAIIFGSIGVYASQILSKDISYTKKDGTTTNVEGALNDLYSKKQAPLLVGQYGAIQTSSAQSSGGLYLPIYTDTQYLTHDISNRKVIIKKAGNYTIRYSIGIQSNQSSQPNYIIKVNGVEKGSLSINKTEESSGVNELNIYLNENDYIIGYISGGGNTSANYMTLIFYNE